MNRRVLYLIGSGAVGGTETQLAQLVGHLRGYGWDPGVVFILDGGPIRDRIAAEGIATWAPPPRRPATEARGLRRIISTASMILQAARLIRRATKEFQPDVVHALLPTSVWVGLSVVSGRRITKIAGIRGFTPELHPLIRATYQRQLRRAAAVVCNSPHLADEMEQIYGVQSDRLVVIPNGVTLPARLSDPSTQPPVGVMVANFHPYKGHDVLVNALTDVEPAVSIRLCGDGARRDVLADLVTDLDLSDRVVLVEPPAAVWDEFHAAQFAVHPSNTEGFPNAVLEAMACGLPVVATDVGGTSRLIDHDVTGLLVPPAQPRELAAAITRLATDPDLRTRLGAAARARASRYSWELCSRAHADLYNRLVDR